MNPLKSEAHYDFGPFRIDIASRVLLRDGQPVALSQRTFDALLILVRERDRLVTKQELMDALWPDVTVEENNLMQQISTLRKALGERADEGKYIRTVPGHGYRFVASVGVSDAEVPSPAGRTPLDPPAEGRATRWLLGIAVVIALLLIVVWKSHRASSSPSPIHSLAVLPFKSLGGEPDAYLGLGMTDVLITRLSNLRGVVVRPTSAVRQFKMGDLDALAAGRELRVDSVLEGTIQRTGSQVRVTARLLAVSDGRSIWGETFDERFTDLFTLEDSICSRLAKSLAVHLSSEQLGRITRRGTDNAEAHQLYLRGRYYSFVRTPDAFRKALDSFQQAIAIDPSYAAPYAGLAEAYYLESTVHLTPQEALPKARAAATNALQLDDSLAEAHAILGAIAFHDDWNFAAAQKEFERAIALNPNCVTAHQWYSELLTALRRVDESVAEAKSAQQIDPLSADVSWNLGLALLFGRRAHEAADVLRQAVELNPRSWVAQSFYAWSLGEQGRFEEARAEALKALALDNNPDTLTQLARIYEIGGRRADAQHIEAELIARATKAYVDPFYIAAAAVAAGDTDRAFTFLQRSYDAHGELLVYINAAPNFDAVRNDPRFVELVRKIGLAGAASTAPRSTTTRSPAF